MMAPAPTIAALSGRTAKTHRLICICIAKSPNGGEAEFTQKIRRFPEVVRYSLTTSQNWAVVYFRLTKRCNVGKGISLRSVPRKKENRLAHLVRRPSRPRGTPAVHLFQSTRSEFRRHPSGT